jgi:hypothetical protein
MSTALPRRFCLYEREGPKAYVKRSNLLVVTRRTVLRSKCGACPPHLDAAIDWGGAASGAPA